MAVAVLDVGKTNVKVVLFDESGAVLAERSRPNAPLPADAAMALSAPRRRRRSGRSSSARSRELNAVAPIATISISTHGAAGVLVDENGPCPPPMDYEFAGFGEIDAEYDAIRPPFEETLSPLRAARPQPRALRLLSTSAAIPNFRARPRVADVSAILAVAADRRARQRSDLARLPRRSLAAARGGAVEPCQSAGLDAAVPAAAPRLGGVRRSARTSRGGRASIPPCACCAARTIPTCRSCRTSSRARARSA